MRADHPQRSPGPRPEMYDMFVYAALKGKVNSQQYLTLTIVNGGIINCAVIFIPPWVRLSVGFR